MTDNKIFAEGIYLNKVSDKAPEYIKSSISLDVNKAITWLESLKTKGVIDEKGYVKLTGKEAKNGKRYFEVDTWKPSNNPSVVPSYPDDEELKPEDIPFK